MSTNLRARLSACALVPILAARAAAGQPPPVADVFLVDESTEGARHAVAADAADESDGGAFDTVGRPVFAADFESGSFAAWDAVVDPEQDRTEFLAQGCE